MADFLDRLGDELRLASTRPADTNGLAEPAPRFIDSLGRELMDAFTRRQPVAKLHRPPRVAVAAGGALALITAIVAVVLGTAGSRATPAYAVTRNADGSVTLTVTELVGVRGANEQLARLGVPVVVARLEPGCTATGEVVESSSPQEHDIVEIEKPGGPGGQRWVIHPRAIPAGDTVQIWARYANEGKPVTIDGRTGYAVAGGSTIFRGPAPTCVRPETSGP